jgi:hypothetical protein
MEDLYAPSTLGHKGLPFPVGGPSLQNANVRCLVFDTTPQTAVLQVTASFSSMMETVLSVAMLEQEWAGHNEVSDPSAPLHAF